MLQSHQQWARVLFSPEQYQNLLFVVFLLLATLTAVRWYFTTISIFISLVISDAERLSRVCWRLPPFWPSAPFQRGPCVPLPGFAVLGALSVLQVCPCSSASFQAVCLGAPFIWGAHAVSPHTWRHSETPGWNPLALSGNPFPLCSALGKPALCHFSPRGVCLSWESSLVVAL